MFSNHTDVQIEVRDIFFDLKTVDGWRYGDDELEIRKIPQKKMGALEENGKEVLDFFPATSGQQSDRPLIFVQVEYFEGFFPGEVGFDDVDQRMAHKFAIDTPLAIERNLKGEDYHQLMD